MRVVFKECVCDSEPFPLIQSAGLAAVACRLFYLVQYKESLLVEQTNRSVFHEDQLF